MAKKDTRLSGIDPLSYMGVFAESPQNVFSNNRAPTTQDKKNFNLGALWVDSSTLDVWYLAALIGGSATWIKFGTPITTVITFDCDTGSATQVGGEIDIFGGDLIDTSASGNTVTFGLTNGANGQLIVGSTAGSPAWADLTSTGTTFTITAGANTLNLESAGGVVTLSQIDGDSGSALPVAGVITVAGGTNLNTSAAVSTLTVNLNDAVTLAGTLTLSALGAGVMQTDATGLVTSDNGTNGQLLIGGGAAPAWDNITSTGGTVTITNGANTINLEATGGGGGGVGLSGFFACQEIDTGLLPGAYYPPGLPMYIGTHVITTEVFDSGGDLYPGNGLGFMGGLPALFTAPQTGKYFLSMRMSATIQNYALQVTAYIIETSNRIYAPCRLVDNGVGWPTGPGPSRSISVYADMDAGDTAKFGGTFYVPGKIFKIRGSSVSSPLTWISGYLVV